MCIPLQFMSKIAKRSICAIVGPRDRDLNADPGKQLLMFQSNNARTKIIYFLIAGVKINNIYF